MEKYDAKNKREDVTLGLKEERTTDKHAIFVQRRAKYEPPRVLDFWCWVAGKELWYFMVNLRIPIWWLQLVDIITRCCSTSFKP